jgi:molecular chaperone DnaK
LSTNGDTHLGGDDFDHEIIDWLAADFYLKKVLTCVWPNVITTFERSCWKSKIELSSTETEINLPYVTATASGPKHLVKKLTRAKFEQLTDALVKRSMAPVARALKDAGLSVSDIDEVSL